MGTLDAKVALVTGGAGGIGGATCRALAAEGAHVAVVDHDGAGAERVAAEVTDAGRRARAIATDVTARDEVHASVEQTVRELGRLDIVVHAAGIGRPEPLLTCSEEAWDSVLAVNLKAAFLYAQAAVPFMAGSGWGRIVHITSRAAHKARADTPAYAASKGGLLAFSRSLAGEVGRHAITVNCVAPGTTVTPMVEAGIGGPDEQLANAAEMGVVLEPLRLATVDEIAGAVLYLCGPHSDHVTGSTLHVNGGSFMP